MREPKVTIYHAKDGWRWRLRAANGRIVAESGEAYTERGKAFAGYRRVALLFVADHHGAGLIVEMG